jgi:hypothetical protein
VLNPIPPALAGGGLPDAAVKSGAVKVKRGQVREVAFLELLGDEARRGECFHENNPLTMDRVFPGRVANPIVPMTACLQP